MTDPATPAPSPEPMAPLSLEERARAAGLAMLSLHAGDVAALSVERDRLASEVETLRSQLAAAQRERDVAARHYDAASERRAKAEAERDEARRERDEARAGYDLAMQDLAAEIGRTRAGIEAERDDLMARLEKSRAERFADDIWDVLEEECGAARAGEARQRGIFRRYLLGQLESGGLAEFRFMGSLGWGGKVYVDRTTCRVGCYSEDETPERRKAIDSANARLAALRSALTGKGS